MVRRTFKNTLAALASVVTALAVSFANGYFDGMFAMSVGATGVEYEMSEQYRTGKYYENLTAVSLTGDGAKDVVAIALSQLGYHEGDSEDELGGTVADGTRDFVEYNRLYGKLDNGQGNGKSYGYYWCASFVNWCMRQAGVSEKATAGAEVSCQRWLSACKSAGIYSESGGYAPISGDMIFFKDIGSSVSSTHVGIVVYSDSRSVYTVEGNTTGDDEFSADGEYVAMKSYPLDSGYIVGYATPKYTESSYRRVDHTEKLLTAGQYISTTGIQVYSDKELTNTCEELDGFRVFSVTDISGGVFEISYTCGGESKHGFIGKSGDIKQLTSSVDVYTVNYVDTNGQALFYPQYRVSGEAKSAYKNAPYRDGCGFVGWEMRHDKGSTVFEAGDRLPNFDGDITLYAVWDESFYLVTFANADGTVMSQMYGYYGTKFEMPDPPTPPSGYTFVGWENDPDGVIRGNATYTAKFAVTETASGSENDSDTAENAGGCSSSIGAYAVSLPAVCGALAVLIKKKGRTS